MALVHAGAPQMRRKRRVALDVFFVSQYFAQLDLEIGDSVKLRILAKG
jgi:hypothetical protein